MLPVPRPEAGNGVGGVRCCSRSGWHPGRRQITRMAWAMLTGEDAGECLPHVVKRRAARGDPVYRTLVSTPGLRATFVVDRETSRILTFEFHGR